MFLHRIHALFVKRECLKCGFTRMILDSLERQRTAVTSTGEVVLGGPDAVSVEVVHRCLQRMCNWVALVCKTVDAEFPYFEVIQAFSISH